MPNRRRDTSSYFIIRLVPPQFIISILSYSKEQKAIIQLYKQELMYNKVNTLVVEYI